MKELIARSPQSIFEGGCKQFVIELEGDLDEARRATLEELAGELLSNPVIENYTMTVLDDEAGA